LVNYQYADAGEWRMMFAWGMAPALLLVAAGIFLPETPSWLMAHQREDAAVETFGKLRRDQHWKKGLAEMRRSASPHKHRGWKTLFESRFRFVLILGLCLSAFQQITGINTVIFYAPKIFQETGFSSASTAIFATVGIGIINVCATALSTWLLDRLGRRPLLLLGVGGMILSLLVLSGAFFIQSSSIDLIAVISLMCYVACFAIGFGPITWLILSEIYPLSIRGKATTVAISLNSLCNYAVSLAFLDLIGALGISGTFTVFAGISAIALAVIWRYVPETKGKRLEEIEKELIK
jgi:sugar porter (SP) family MFS transporter